MRAALTLSTLALVACGGLGQRPPPRVEAPAEPASSLLRWSTDGGLDVLLVPGDDEAVAAQLWLEAGAAHGPAGAAALVQALVAEPLGPALAALGARLDTWIAPDAAVFEVVCTPDRLDAVLAALAAALRATPTLDAQVAARLDATHQRARRDPARRVARALAGRAWAGHPYARGALSAPGRVAQLDAQAAAELHLRRYVPAGARLVLVGGVDEDDARAAVEAAFGGWRGALRDSTPPVPALEGPALHIERDPGVRARLAVAFPVEVTDPDDGARLDLLAAALGGPEGRIARDARLRGVPVDAVRVALLELKGSARLVVHATAPADAVDAAWGALSAALLGVADRPLTATEIDRARRALRRRAELHGDTPADRARRVGARALRRDADLAGARWRAVVDRATPAAVSRRAGAILTIDGLSAVALVPTHVEVPDDGLWAESMLGQARAAAADEGAVRAGRNEVAPLVELVIHPRPGRGAVTVYAAARGGLAAEPPRHGGVARVVAHALAGPGPGGLRYRAAARTDHLAIWVEAPAGELEAALAGVAGRLGGQAPTPGAFEGARGEVVDAVAELVDHPAALADALLAQALARGPRAPDRLAATLPTVTPAVAAAWFEANVVHAPVVLVVSGDVTPRRAQRALQGLFADPRLAVGGRAPSTPREAMVERATDGRETVLAVGFARPLRDPDDRATLEVLAEALAGADSELHRQLAALGAEVRPLVWLAGPESAVGLRLSTPDDAAGARVLIDAAVHKLRSVPIRRAELEAAQARLVARATVALQDGVARARWLARNVLEGHPYVGPDALAAWRAAIGRVTAQRLQSFAATTLDPAARAVVRVGPAPAPAVTRAPNPKRSTP